MISDDDAALVWTMQVDFVDADILARWQGVLGPDEIACAARCFSAAHLAGSANNIERSVEVVLVYPKSSYVRR